MTLFSLFGALFVWYIKWGNRFEVMMLRLYEGVDYAASIVELCFSLCANSLLYACWGHAGVYELLGYSVSIVTWTILHLVLAPCFIVRQ